MHELVLWAGFLGAWLLVVGPLFQALLELQDEELEQDRIRDTMLSMAPPGPVSRWWLLLPPVWWVKHNRRRAEFMEQLLAHLSDEDYEAFSSFMKKARGWIFVGLGGLLIAAKETWELVEGHEWPSWLFWALVVLGLIVSLGNLALYGVADQRQRERRRQLRDGT
ncbi:hypothetical protein D9V37_11210 [Nocardioides mangrovicus]|uniref:Uncharacterized protein n=1 Tax=Nocardioides mangrovicus TaxID=2478913 RepID=A0A3L8P2C5_9ACTN|nr:hypothetical protein [Nocardioides mangrovicus]RLV49127.1 hypothetical protein D9V37_11210 [Nocardioides mangrovicus]